MSGLPLSRKEGSNYSLTNNIQHYTITESIVQRLNNKQDCNLSICQIEFCELIAISNEL